MKLNAIYITNYSFNCNHCQSITNIKYETISGNKYCDKCVLSTGVYKYKDNYIPTIIGDYSKINYKDIDVSLKFVENQIKNINKK